MQAPISLKLITHPNTLLDTKMSPTLEAHRL